ncbi:MAG TPA: glycosyltransferase family 1 protein [Vicinamibacterales bacterium]|nr:glycosyltransferase family 1 protein [Vicinamibacterales bacterium]
MTPLRIGIDARELLGDRTGVGRYLGELLARWVTRRDAAQRCFILYAPEPLLLSFPPSLVHVRVAPGGRGTLWEQTTLATALAGDRPDVFFAPAYTAPVRLGLPFVVTVHDVSFSRHPEWFRLREGTRRRLLTRHAARRAALVLTVSDFSRHEIQELYGVPPARIQVVPNGVTRRAPPPSTRREPLVLYAGSIFNRRRVPDLLAAFARVACDVSDARLVIVGDNRTWPRQDLAALARAHGIAERVSLRQYAADDELAALYARASVFVFLSEYEGFGLTPLEALSAGVPVVVADTPVAREVCGEAADLVPVGDVEGTAERILRILRHPHAAAERLAHAPAVLARYSWELAAERTLAAIEGVARR